MPLFDPGRRDRQWHSILRGTIQIAAAGQINNARVTRPPPALMRARPQRIISFMPASLSIERLKAKTYRKRVPSPIPQLEALIRAIDALGPSPRLPADLLSEYRSALRNLVRRAKHIERLNARRSAYLTITKWRVRLGVRLADTYNLDQQLAWLLDRQKTGRNVHAMAQGKRTFAKLGREHYVRIGKLGAAARWHRERAVDFPQCADLAATGERSDSD
jgi:hypothetical protein